MASSLENSQGDVGFQIAPMIDLILVLLVFFMSTVAMRQVETELGISVPRGIRGEARNIEMNVTIDGQGGVYLNDELLAAGTDKQASKLIEKLKEQVSLVDEKIPVIISPQADVVHSRVIDVLNACAAAHVKNITFSNS